MLSLWQQHPLICVCTIHRRQTTLNIIVYADRKKMSVTRAVQKSWEKIHADKRLQFNRSITVAAITDLTDSPGFQIFILKRENLTLNVDNKETTAVMSSWCFCILLFFSSSLFIFLIIFQWKKKQFCSQRSLSLFTQLCLWFCFSLRTQHVSGSSVDPSTCLIFESEM